MTRWEWRGWPMWWVRTRSILGLAAIVYSVLTVAPRPLWRGVGLLVGLLLLVVVVGWLSWLLSDSSRARWLGPMIGGAAGVVITYVVPHSAAFALPAMSCVNASRWLAVRVASTWFLGLSVAYLVGHGVIGTGPAWLVVGPASCFAGVMIGLVRRQNERLLAQTEATREEHARAAALAERARIAREIHDVLAHSLAALTVQLETADALLEGGRVGQARDSVVRAGQLAREGLAETRRAIGALRGDTVLSLPDLLAGLAAGYRADLGAPAAVEIEGEPREMGADRGLALYRTAQEAMTNVRKHAPGAPVRMMLRFGPDRVSLRVCSGAPPAGVDRPLAAAGGGYGLTGLRERAELAGGEFEAGPDGAGWRVDVRIPT